jgi:hypothetical protein
MLSYLDGFGQQVVSVFPHTRLTRLLLVKSLQPSNLRSWIGAYKHLKVCIPHYSALLSPLEQATAGKNFQDKVDWSEPLSIAFLAAQKALKDPKTITVPRPSDQLIITSDGAVRNGGVGSVLFIRRDGKLKIGGYFSAKLTVWQQKWLPCEVEALAISLAVSHWGPHILESQHPCQILSDSKPCVQAYGKLQRGCFSTSARISAFLSSLSRYNITLQHIAGSKNLPADYLSRSPMECVYRDCQICMFIKDSDRTIIREVSVSDVLDGTVSIPFSNRSSWKTTQQDCPHLRRTYAHLSQGTRPLKKDTHSPEVKRYLQVASVSANGLLIVHRAAPFGPFKDLVIIPQRILPGILTALHLRLSHPTKFQLKSVFHRHFYALDADKAIDTVTQLCSQCASIAKLPKEVVQFSTSKSPDRPGLAFSCDVMCRARQKVIALRDDFSSYTKAAIIPDETASTLSAAIVELTADLKASVTITVRVDGGMQCLANDSLLNDHRIKIIVGRLKNVNKNPIGEKTIQELEYELKRVYPSGNPITPYQLASVVSVLNGRIRNRGLSAKEILYQRDNDTGHQLNFDDAHLADLQYTNRYKAHEASAKAKAPKGQKATDCMVHPGDLVFMKNEGSKHTVRHKYIVSSCHDGYIFIKKLVGSQYRTKEYKVKSSEIYLVPFSSHSVPPYKVPDPYAVDDSSDSDILSEVSVDDMGTVAENVMNPAVDAIDHPPDDHEYLFDNVDLPADEQNDPSAEQHEASSSGESDTENVVHRQSSRRSNRPSWMTDGQWQMD